MGKSGRYRKRRRPLTPKQARKLAGREREVGLRREDRTDSTTNLPFPVEKFGPNGSSRNRPEGRKS